MYYWGGKILWKLSRSRKRKEVPKNGKFYLKNRINRRTPEQYFDSTRVFCGLKIKNELRVFIFLFLLILSLSIQLHIQELKFLQCENWEMNVREIGGPIHKM